MEQVGIFEKLNERYSSEKLLQEILKAISVLFRIQYNIPNEKIIDATENTKCFDMDFLKM